MHFVTFRLAGTLPRDVLHRLQARKEQLLDQQPAGLTVRAHRLRVHKLIFAAYDDYLDHHCDIAWLSDPRIAALVRSSLYHFHGERYGLLAYTILSNHVHALLLPFGIEPPRDCEMIVEPGESQDASSPLSGIMHSLKGYTAHEANKILCRKGQFWQHESYDHWVRDEDELERIVEYINANPVNAGLAARPHDHSWGSAHDRFLIDGDTSGWLPVP
jgi:putative DNA methylase